MRLNQMKVLSLCDYSGKWAKPYADAGHTVFLVDPKHRPADGENVWTFEDGMMRCSDTARGFLNLLRQGWIKPDFDVILIAVPYRFCFIRGKVFQGQRPRRAHGAVC